MLCVFTDLSVLLVLYPSWNHISSNSISPMLVALRGTSTGLRRNGHHTLTMHTGNRGSSSADYAGGEPYKVTGGLSWAAGLLAG